MTKSFLFSVSFFVIMGLTACDQSETLVEQMIEANHSKMLFLSDGLVSIPEKSGKFYDMYIGENLSDHVVRWHTFYLSEKLNEILVDDVITGNNLTLEEWRKQGAH